MTVNYTQDVATQKIGGFLRLLFRWRGSIYQAIYGEVLIFLTLYISLSLVYRFGLDEPHRTNFERMCLYCEQFADSIPVTFILGFYLVRVIGRRWTIWENMPWPDRFALDVSVYITGYDFKSRIIRRTLVRYANLASILCFRDICVPIRKRFPSLDHLINAGLLTPEEKVLFVQTANKFDNNWWIPFHWAYTLARRVQIEGKMEENPTLRLLDGIDSLRNKCWVLFSHDWIPIPMIYTQVCTLSVHLFMLASLFGRQWLDPEKMYPRHQTDLYFPFFTLFQLTFYLGWLKVAEIFINPLGLDADDFDMNYIVERNLRTSYTIVDDNYNKLPPVEKDKHWGENNPIMPHTAASKGLKNMPFVGSVTNLRFSHLESQQVHNDSVISYGSTGPLLNETDDATSASNLSDLMKSRSKSLREVKKSNLYQKHIRRQTSLKANPREILEDINETSEM